MRILNIRPLVILYTLFLSSLLFGCTPKSDSDTTKSVYFTPSTKNTFATSDISVNNITLALYVNFEAADSFACKVLEKSISKNNKDAANSQITVDAVYDNVEKETQVTFTTVSLKNKNSKEYISELKTVAKQNKHEIIDTIINGHSVTKIAEERNGYTIFRVVLTETINSVKRLDFLVPNQYLVAMAPVVNNAINSIKIGNK